MSTHFVTPSNARRARSDTMSRSPRGERRDFQIGPRIRIGGSIGKIGQNIKIATGKALSNPIVDGALTLIPGVGPGLAAAAGATGKILDTSNGGIHGASGVLDVAKGAAEGYGAGKVTGLLKSGIGNIIGDATGAGSVVSGGASSGDPSNGGTGDTTSGDGSSSGWLSAVQKAISTGGDVLGAINSATGGGSLLDKGLLAAAVADAAATKARQQDLQDKGLAVKTDAYAATQPLRDQGLSLLQQQKAPDLSFVANPANKYTRLPATPALSGQTPILPTGGTY